jgi:hypothetical protein
LEFKEDIDAERKKRDIVFAIQWMNNRSIACRVWDAEPSSNEMM